MAQWGSFDAFHASFPRTLTAWCETGRGRGVAHPVSLSSCKPRAKYAPPPFCLAGRQAPYLLGDERSPGLVSSGWRCGKLHTHASSFTPPRRVGMAATRWQRSQTPSRAAFRGESPGFGSLIGGASRPTAWAGKRRESSGRRKPEVWQGAQAPGRGRQVKPRRRPSRANPQSSGRFWYDNGLRLV